MGNCIIGEKKAMQTGWENKEAMKVDGDMVGGGEMYFPVESEGDINGVVRIKLIITKQELEVMLRKGGVSVGDLVSHTKKESCDVVDNEENRNCGRWKPVLDSIPEL